MIEFEFKVGDRVKCYFYGDKVFTLVREGSFFRLNNKRELFWDNGKYQDSHSAPVLTLVERPNKKVEVTFNGEGVYFGGCFISHDAILEGRGPVVRSNYKKWMEYEI